MARMLNRLTANQIKAAKGKQMLPDGGGLYLQVTSDAAKSWLFRYRWKGKRPEIGLGPYPAVTLAEARRRADVARAALAEMPPLDPKVALRDTGEPSPAFADWAEEWLSANLESFSNTKHRQQWRNTLDGRMVCNGKGFRFGQRRGAAPFFDGINITQKR